MFDTSNAHHSMSAGTLAPTSTSVGLSSLVASDSLVENINTSKNNHLVFVDAAVSNIEQIFAGLASSQVVVLDGEQNSIEQITDTLAQYVHTPLDSFHIISHGDRGSLQLGNTVLNAESLTEYADELTGWGSAIAPEGDILLYGCNVAADPAGHSFIQQLSQLTGADVAASNDLTGQGGDWDLEVTTGSIEAQIILDTVAQKTYQGTLATYNGNEYTLTTSAKTWEQAQKEAIAQGGNLVTINNADEYAWLQETFGTSRYLWMGLNDVQQEGNFEWASGEAVTYTNWAPGDPNDARGNQDYGRINFGKNDLWDDAYSYNKFFGIIERNSNESNSNEQNNNSDNSQPDSDTDTVTAPDGDVFQDHTYVLTSDKLTWEAAQAEAVALGGNLVTVNTAEEYGWLQETFGNNQSLWTGLSDRQQEGQFSWASGEALTYTNWAPGHPNGGSRGSQDYVRMNFGKNRLWDDTLGTKTFFGIIEIDSSNNVPDAGGSAGAGAGAVSGEGPDTNPPVVAPIPDDSFDVFSRIVPVNYSGYNVNAATIGDWNDSDNLQAIAEATKEIGGQTLRVPGGDTANFWDWDIGGIITERNPDTDPYDLEEPLPVALRYKRNINATLENVDSLLTGADADPIWVVNMLTSDLQTEIDHLLEAKRLGMSVDRIELGNEFYFQIPNYTSKDKTPLDYAIRAKEWALAIREVPELADATLAVTGSTSTVRSQRGQTWMEAMTTKTGKDNLSVIDVVDAYTLHPYYKTDTLNVSKSDVGNRARAGEIARDGTAELRDILAAPALNTAALKNEEVWITEHNIIEKGSIVIGNSWLHALMLDLNTQDFLKDERTTASIAHVLIGNSQWQGLIGAEGTQIDASLRGKVDSPVTQDPSDAFNPTAIGLVLGKTADVFTGGTATLLHSSEASVAWRVQNSADTISMVNADDRRESLVLPAGQTWQVTTYTADPWSTPASDDDLQITTRTISGSSTLSVAGFSKVIAVAV